uniref:Ig-like domain-containing protein n=1 Tax=Canis lupus dingo TaxID=286419 RepID=A0A8C0KXM0_CANLU
MTPALTVLLCLGERTLPKPTIWAEPGSVVPWEAPVTIWCQGSLKAQEYFLYKERYSGTWNRQPELEFKDKAKFSITHMTDVYAGQYHCYYRSTTAWSNPSDPLELVVTGVSPLRSPSPVVTSGQNLTLQCLSDVSYDRFVLSKEGARDLLHRHGWQSQAGLSGADFPLGPVGPFHRGRYTCYGGHNLSSQWSASSGPLDILVAGEGPQCRESPRLYTGPCEGSPSWYLYVLIGSSVAFILMLCLLILFLVRQQRRGKCRKSSKKGLRHPRGGGALWADPGWAQGSSQREPREVGKADVGHFHRISSQRTNLPLTVCLQKNTQDEEPHGDMYAQVLATPPSSLSGGLQDSEDRQAEEDRWMDSQAAASDAPPDVTYAQLNHLTLRQKTSASSPSQSGEPPAEPSVYAALAIH